MVWSYLNFCLTKINLKRRQAKGKIDTQHDPEAFITPQWPQVPWWTFLLFRCITTLYFSVWLITSWILFKDNKKGKEKWLIFLTNWSFVFLVLQSYCLTIPILIKTQNKCLLPANSKKNKVPKEVPVLELEDIKEVIDVNQVTNSPGLGFTLKLAWIVDNIASPMAIGVTIAYWGFLYDHDQPISSVSIHTHGINAMYVIVDQVLCRRPRKFFHIYQPIVFGLIYVFFSFLYYRFGGTDPKGNHFIYPFLNWEKPLTTIKYTFLFAILLGALSYLLVYGLYKLRSFIHQKFCNQPAPLTVPISCNNNPPSEQELVSFLQVKV